MKINSSFSYDDSGLKKLQRNLDAINGQHDVKITDLMTDSFVQRHSKFKSLQALFDASGIEKSEDIGNETFTKFIATHTSFGNWDEMKNKAAEEYLKRKLES